MLKITARQIVAGAGTGLLAGTLVAALESDFQGQICEYNQATNHEDCAIYSIFPFLLIQVGKTLNNYGVAITALATVAIGIFTLTLKLSTDQLWEAGEKQRKLSEDTAKHQLRAYLGVKAGAIISHDGGNTFVIEVEIINTGLTPARQVTHSITGELQDRYYGPPPTFRIPLRTPGQWVIVPNMTLTLKRDIAIGGSSGIVPINEGRKIIFTWGRVDYVDVFDRPQYFEFRYRSTGPIINQKGAFIGWQMRPEDHGNRAT